MEQPDKKIVPYDVKAEQKRQQAIKAAIGEITGIPTSILKEQATPFDADAVEPEL